ncbi:MAG: Trk family potassium uptake protein [Chloroflexi bacterium]|nr:Trk family potassium uptake protein [Chloroflexota bacterium]
MEVNPPRRPRDSVIRQPRVDQLQPTFAEPVPRRHPRRIFSTPFLLSFGFAALIIFGGLLLSLPISSSAGVFTPLILAFFTATSAVTVTGHTVVDTPTYWSHFGQAIIFFLMLIGGLSFMAAATFILALLGQRSSLSERLVLRDTMGLDRMEGLRRITRNIVIVVFLIYLIGAGVIFWRINGLDGMGIGESIWQSIFLSVSAFNNAGFSILPASPAGSGLARIATAETLLFTLIILIVLGGIGWTSLVDIYRHRRFSRLNLDTKLVVVTSLLLWVVGALVLFFAEFSNPETYGGLSMVDRISDSIFHSVSGRTAGFATFDFGLSDDFTKLTYPALMFVGGASGSVAGGIKVNTFAVIIAAVISSIKGRPQAEAFGREISQHQVLRALTVGVLGVLFIILVLSTLTLTEPDIPFLDLLFDTVSAFGTTGASTGIVPELSVIGKSIFMLTMFIGRLGPLTLALALAPREQTLYRYVQERVTIG